MWAPIILNPVCYELNDVGIVNANKVESFFVKKYFFPASSFHGCDNVSSEKE